MTRSGRAAGESATFLPGLALLIDTSGSRPVLTGSRPGEPDGADDREVVVRESVVQERRLHDGRVGMGDSRQTAVIVSTIVMTMVVRAVVS